MSTDFTEPYRSKYPLTVAANIITWQNSGQNHFPSLASASETPGIPVAISNTFIGGISWLKKKNLHLVHSFYSF